MHQIDFSELKALPEDSEKASKIRSILFMQRIEKTQDSITFLENFSESLEDFSLSLHQSPFEAILLILETLKFSLKLQVLMIFSLILPEKSTPNPLIFALFLEKLKLLLKESETKQLNSIFFQLQILDFIRASLLLQEIRAEFPSYFEENIYLEDLPTDEFIIYEENPKFKKFQNIDFCLKPHEILQDYSGNFQEIPPIFSNKTFNEEEVISCFGSLAKTYPLLEDASQRLLNEIFENHKDPGILTANAEKFLEKKTVNCNLDGFLKIVSGLDCQIKWSQILNKLDKKVLSKIYKDQKFLTNLLKIVQRFRKLYNQPFPVSIIFSKWINQHCQIQFLLNLFQIGIPELISWPEITNKKIISLDFNPALRYQSLSPPILQFWCCLEFLELLVECSETEYYFQIRNLFEVPLAKCPDILIIGLSQIKPKLGLVFLEELFSNLFPLYLLNHSNSIPILEALWKYNEKLMIEAIFSLYRKENSSLNLSRVLDITQEIKDSLIPLTNCYNLNFSVSLGILASKREFLHFEHWLTERIKSIGNPFIAVLLKYIEENVIFQCDLLEKSQPNFQGNFPANPQNYLNILEKAQMSLETLGIIMESLLGTGFDKLTVKNQKKSKEVFSAICKFFPALAGVNESSKLEIETATNNYFQKLFYKEIRPEEFVDILGKLKNSNNPSEKEIYACIMHYLFDEFRHHEEYAMDILLITGSTFGNMINSKYKNNDLTVLFLKLLIDC